MIRLRIDVVGDPLPRVEYEDLQAAVRRGALRAAQFAKGLWIRRAQQLDIRRTGDYIRGIQEHGIIRPVSAEMLGASFEIEIDVVNTAKHASIVEDGHAAFSLPQRINWNGPNVKRGRNGPYLHIPFRHHLYQDAADRRASGMTQGAIRQMMPPEVSAAAKTLRFRTPGQPRERLARTTSPGVVLGGAGADQRFVEHRSGRFVGRAGGQALHNPAWGSSRFHGMFRAGRSRHSRFMTIRTITPTSRGWRIPAMHGHGVARQVGYALSRGAQQEVAAGFIRSSILELFGES